jgi:hypothetical protein
VKGLRFERIGKNRHYNVVFHMGSSYVPVTDETVEELKAQSLLPVERFLELLIDRVGYSSYLKDQIRTELKSSGDPVTQITVLQGAIRELYSAAENSLQLLSQSHASLRRTARARLSRPASCGLAGGNFEQPLESPEKTPNFVLVSKNPQRTPEGTPPVFSRLRPR